MNENKTKICITVFVNENVICFIKYTTTTTTTTTTAFANPYYVHMIPYPSSCVCRHVHAQPINAQ